MGTPHVILVRAAYYGILSLFTDFVEVLSEVLLKNRRRRSLRWGTGMRFIQECCVVPDFVNTKLRFLVVLRHIVIRYGDVRGTRTPPASSRHPLRRLDLEPRWSPLSPHPVAAAVKCVQPVWNEPLFLPRASMSLRWCCHLAFRRRRVSMGRGTSTVACECCSHRGLKATNV